MSHLQHHFGASSELYREKAACLIELGQMEDAETALTVSLQMKPDDERTLGLQKKMLTVRSSLP